MKSIQNKFIVLILGCILLCSAVIGRAGISNAKQVVDEDSAKIMNLMCEEKANDLGGLFSCIEQSVGTLAVYALEQLEDVEKLKSNPAYMETYTQGIESVAVNAANNTEGALAVYVRYNPEFAPPTSGIFWSKTEENGSFQRLVPTDFSTYSSNDVEHVGWYYIPVKNGKATWMAPYMNQNIAKRMVSYVIPIYKDNETIGVVGMDIDFTVIEKTVAETKVYQSGYAFLAEESGTVIYHPSLDFGVAMGENENLVSVVNEMKNTSSGSNLFSYEWKGQDKKMAFRTLQNGMRLVITAPVLEIDEARNNLTRLIVIAVLVIASFSVILTIVFTRRLIRPLKELNVAAQKIAAGDLSISLNMESKDEVGTLADSFQQTVEHLQKYIDYINGLAYRDSLTGVKNKTAYQETERRMDEQMRLGHPEFAVVVLDINGLKNINDNYGHDFGDLLIIDASRLICRIFQHSPVYRIGGDEFVVILENADYKNYAGLLEAFQIGMEEYNRSSNFANYFSIARGIAVYSSDTDLVFANVFKRADEAMYQNKAAMKKRS